MGLLEFGSRIVSTYTANTSQHKAAIKELSGEQKKAAQEELKRIEAANGKVENQIKTLGKLAVVVGSVGVAAKIAFDALEFAGRRADLQATANIESMEGLKKATRGLMTETQLLEQAAKIQQGTYKLSQKELENVTGAMTALGEKGNDSTAVMDAFTDALVTGKTKGLKAFGIEVYEGGNRLETHNAILHKAAQLTKEFAAGQMDGADKMSQAKVTFADATDSLKVSIASTAESMTPMVSALADIVRLLAETGAAGPLAIGLLGAAITGNPAIGALLAFGAAGGFSDVTEAMFDPQAYAARMRGVTAGGTMQGAAALSAAQRLKAQTMGLVPGLEMDVGSVGVKSLPDMKKAAAAAEARRKKLDELSWKEMKDLTDALLEREGEGYIKGWAGAGANEGLAGRNADSFHLPQGEAGIDWDSAKANITQAGLLANEALNSVQGPSILERMFGKREDMDGYAESWSAMTSMASAGYNAMVDGTMSLGQAVKKAAADAIKSIGLKMLIEGLEQTATGIKMAAGVYTAPLAPGHFAAAAKFFAGAAIAGVAAHALGGGGGGVGGGAGRSPGAPSYQGPNSGAYQGGQNVTIVYGDQFADDSPRNRQRTAQKLVSKALGSSGGTYS